MSGQEVTTDPMSEHHMGPQLIANATTNVRPTAAARFEAFLLQEAPHRLVRALVGGVVVVVVAVRRPDGRSEAVLVSQARGVRAVQVVDRRRPCARSGARVRRELVVS